MDARAPRAKNYPVKNRKPARVLDDVELVTFSSDATFRRARKEWLRDILRQGDPQQFALCYAVSSYMGYAKGGAAWTDQHRLAVDLNCSVKTVGRWLDAAVANGHLISQRRGANTNIYRMSFSPSRRGTIELEFDNRMDDFTVESARRRLKKQASYSDRFVGIDQSGLSDVSGQVCPNNSVRSVRQSYPSSSEGDPDRPSTVRLGEGAPDIEGDEVEQKKTSRDEVISVLGHGDLQMGEDAAATLGPARLAYLVRLVDDEGMVGAHQAIVEARKSAAPRR